MVRKALTSDSIRFETPFIIPGFFLNMGRVVEVPPEKVRKRLEEMGAEFLEAREDEGWRAKHGGSVIAGHENGVVVYGGYEKIEEVLKEPGDRDEKEVGDGKGTVLLEFDGASRGNPGEASIAYVVKNPNGHIVTKDSDTIDWATNNEAEYLALLAGLKKASELGYSEVEASGDSQLIVKQVKGEWRCKSENLQPLHEEVLELIDGFDSFEIRHVPRELNKEADRLANQALDKQGKE